MHILFTSAEAAPFAKVGGLGDVVAAGSLPTALRKLGIDARVILPMYGTIPRSKFNIKPTFSFQLPRTVGTAFIQVHQTVWHDVPFYFIESWPFFGVERSVYSTWENDVPRFIFFNQAAMATAWQLKQRENWFPDIFHVNDWHTGLIPFFLKESTDEPEWANIRSIMTIHNLAYQGDAAGGWLWELGIPGREHPELQRLGLSDNLLAIGTAYADFVTTVSPRHADEIQYSYMGYGLDELIRSRTYDNKLYGVLNGIDVEKFDPANDPHITKHFNAYNFVDQRKENKRQLQSDCALAVRDDVPIIGLVSRMVWQKGIDLVAPAIRQILEEQDVQFVALGTGDPELCHQMWLLAEDFPDKARVFISYDVAIAQQIYAGIDLFVMPSHYEPCGIGQMIAMRYGVLPIVRETGGLADTVENYDNHDAEKGTGFVFLWEDVDALVNTIRWALETYGDKPEAFRQMQKRAMQQDFSWERSAKIYRDLYKQTLASSNGSTHKF
jgi:starch synthase